VTEAPVATDYRLADPFPATWYAISDGEPTAETRMLADYEVLGFASVRAAGEEAYQLTLRSVVPRGYARSEFLIARSDYALLEQRHYVGDSATPALIAVAPRSSMIQFGDHTLPARMLYDDRVEHATIEVRLRHTPLNDGSDELFFPASFHRAVIPTRTER